MLKISGFVIIVVNLEMSLTSLWHSEGLTPCVPGKT